MRIVVKSFDQKPPFYVCRFMSYSFVISRKELYNIIVNEYGFWDEVRICTSEDENLPGYPDYLELYENY